MPITQFLTDQAAFSPDDHPRYVATCSSEKLAVNQTRRNVGTPNPSSAEQGTYQQGDDCAEILAWFHILNASRSIRRRR